MVAFVVSLIVLFALCAIMVPMAKRRPVGTPMTWGEAMVASVWAFFIMFWAYGVVPHLWLTWADNELQWRPDKILYGPGDILQPQVLGGNFPMTITYQTLRDFVAVGIYVVFLGGQIAMWAWWQDRGKRAAKETTTVVESDFGRPLVRKG